MHIKRAILLLWTAGGTTPAVFAFHGINLYGYKPGRMGPPVNPFPWASACGSPSKADYLPS